MNREIERKFLVKHLPEGFDNLPHYDIEQGYLSVDSVVIRVRFSTQIGLGYLTIKTNPNPDGPGVDEYEYEIPMWDAAELIKKCEHGVIRKTRYLHHGWEIDVFKDVDLVLAEYELLSEDEQIEIPDWVGEEVTGNPKYLNVNIAKGL